MDDSDDSKETEYNKRIQINVTNATINNKELSLLELIPPDGPPKVKPINLILAIDISGSMNDPASNDPESKIYSRLDLIKHAAQTVIQLLRDCDTITLITFNDYSKIIVPTTLMDQRGKQIVSSSLKQLKAFSTTNIWLALNTCLDTALSLDNASIMFFTDGEPTEGLTNANDIIVARRAHTSTTAINTFAFGNKIDSNLLSSISQSNGLFAHISDYTMVGTVFVNFTSGLLSWAHSSITITFNQPVTIMGFGETCTTTIVQLGPIQFQQARHLMICVPANKGGPPGGLSLNPITATFSYDDVLSTVALDGMNEPNDTFYTEYCRALLVETVCAALKEGSIGGALKRINNLAQIIQEYEKYERPMIKAMGNDIYSFEPHLGQISKALERQDWYNSWGKPCLLSFCSAYSLEVNANFKGAGLAFFGGPLFSTLREQGDILFNTLPPPKPSLAPQNKPYVPLQNMSSMNNYDNPCFDGDAYVLMKNKSFKKVKDLKKHDALYGGGHVECLIRTPIVGGVKMVQIDGVWITPFHPIRKGSKWCFPQTINPIQHVALDAVYNLVLTSQHCVHLCMSAFAKKTVVAITLGHGNTVDPVLAHSYLGTQCVIDDLKKYDGYNDGYIVLNPVSIRRDAEWGIIVRM